MLYNTFLLKDRGILSYINPDGTGFSIPCYVEKINMPVAERICTAQISLVCPDPYWMSSAEESVTILGVNGAWQFPWEIPQTGFEIASVYNDGEADIGCVFTIYTRTNAKNPRLENINSFEWFELEIDLYAGDKVIISTVKGHKTVILERDGVNTNIINNRVWGSTFLQLSPGLNEIVCNAHSGKDALSVTVSYIVKYSGI